MQTKLSLGSRYLLGLIFFIFGGAGLFNLFPPPPDLPADLQTFMSGMMVTKYLFPLIKGTEMIAGLLLILGVAPALMLVILAPISLNIFLVHFFLTPGLQNLVLPLIIVGLHVLSAVNYWAVFKPLFAKNK